MRDTMSEIIILCIGPLIIGAGAGIIYYVVREVFREINGK